MSFLSPAKLLIILVVVMIVVGPDKLPGVARQLGAAIQAFKDFHKKVESEVRETIPNLPSTQQIVRMTRSPLSFLNTLADMPSDQLEEPVADPEAPATASGDPAVANGTAGHEVDGAGTAGNGSAPSAGDVSAEAAPSTAATPDWPADVAGPPVLGDPSMN